MFPPGPQGREFTGPHTKASNAEMISMSRRHHFGLEHYYKERRNPTAHHPSLKRLKTEGQA